MSLRLTTGEHDLLETLPAQLLPLLAGDADAREVTQRLYSRGYEDEELERDYRNLVGQDIVEQRTAAMRTFAETLQAGDVDHGQWHAELDADAAAAWLSAVNDARLILGAVMGITVEEQWESADLEDPAVALLHYLGGLQEGLLDALTATLLEE